MGTTDHLQGRSGVGPIGLDPNLTPLNAQRSAAQRRRDIWQIKGTYYAP